MIKKIIILLSLNVILSALEFEELNLDSHIQTIRAFDNNSNFLQLNSRVKDIDTHCLTLLNFFTSCRKRKALSVAQLNQLINQLRSLKNECINLNNYIVQQQDLDLYNLLLHNNFKEIILKCTVLPIVFLGLTYEVIRAVDSEVIADPLVKMELISGLFFAWMLYVGYWVVGKNKILIDTYSASESIQHTIEQLQNYFINLQDS